MKDTILDILVCVGIFLAFALPIWLVDSIINQLTYGDWTCTFKTCIAVKGDKK